MTGSPRHCPVCNAAASTAIYARLDRCAACTHVWADVELDWEALRRIYSPAYFQGEEYGEYLADRRVIEKNFAARLRTLQRFLTPAHRRLFEIGCAYGLFLNAARPLFESVEGIDISAEAVAHATGELGLAAQSGDFLAADLGARRFDVVCLWDTIEHLANPRAYLARAAEHLEPGGLVAFTTGDIGSLVARVQRGRWRLIHPPSHLQYFTTASATRLVEECGFRVVHVEHCGFWRSVHGMIHNLVELGWRSPRLARALQAMVPRNFDLYLNLHDIMFVIAERQ